MSKILTVEGRGIALAGNDIDTDRIIPARYLRSISFDGLGEAVFADDRTQQADHPFDAPHSQGARILVVNRNFGCGSSREHAPQALSRWGIQAIVGESFAQIFFGNCLAIGIPCLTADADTVEQLQRTIVQSPETILTIDLEALQVRLPQQSLPLALAAAPRQMFLSGHWDATGQLLANIEAIRATAARLPYMG